MQEPWNIVVCDCARGIILHARIKLVGTLMIALSLGGFQVIAHLTRGFSWKLIKVHVTFCQPFSPLLNYEYRAAGVNY